MDNYFQLYKDTNQFAHAGSVLVSSYKILSEEYRNKFYNTLNWIEKRCFDDVFAKIYTEKQGVCYGIALTMCYVN
ncbi:hypothetical protein P261_01820 [Lachnospiraceae bacterium TWA4]|nr:hypothetical protein P261_01820 [Lachnospiraceae bacterium TWA4]